MTEVEPVYAQIAQAIRSQIFDGEYALGQKLPSESELCQMFSANRGTVRRAIQLLTVEKIVYSEKGRGTFVATPEEQQSFLGFGSLTDRLDPDHETAVAEVLDSQVILKENRPVLRLRRLRSISSHLGLSPVSIDISFLPMDLFPGIDQIDFTNESIYRILREKYQREPATSLVALNPRLLDKATRHLLRESDAQKCLLHVSGQVFDANGARLEETEVTYSSRVKAVMSVDHRNGHTQPINLKEF